MKSDPSENASAHALVKRLIHGQRVVMMTILSDAGWPESRPMTLLEFDDEGCFWFFFDARAAQAAGPQRLQQVNLSFVDVGRASFVSVAGQAALSRDPQRISELWTPMAKPWFPDGPDSPDLALLKVIPVRVAYWDGPNSSVLRSLAMAASVVSGRPIGLGEHGVITGLGPSGTPGAPAPRD